MKYQLISVISIALLVAVSCQPAPEQPAEQPASEEPDYALFNKKIEVIRSMFQAHSDENLEALNNLLADTLQWSPPQYNGNQWLGKEDLLAALEAYHNDFDNIQFHEGIAGLDDTAGANNAFWSGSVFPENTATSSPNILRVYGTWTATHTETGKEIGVKWFSLVWVNEAGQIARFNDYFDVHGIEAQVMTE